MLAAQLRHKRTDGGILSIVQQGFVDDCSSNHFQRLLVMDESTTSSSHERSSASDPEKFKLHQEQNVQRESTGSQQVLTESSNESSNFDEILGIIDGGLSTLEQNIRDNFAVGDVHLGLGMEEDEFSLATRVAQLEDALNGL